MKVLMLHNRYKISGGEDVSTDVEYNLLKQKGIDIDVFYLNNDSIDFENKFSLAINTIWSKKYYQEILDRILRGRYDILHVQNFFPLFSPSIFYAARRSNTKVIMTVRNYRLVCPNGLMYVKNKLCDDCIGHKIPIFGVLKRCYRESYSASAVTAIMLGFHNLRNTWNDQLDGYICISEFVKKQLQRGGINEPKLFVKYNFVVPELPPNFISGDYYVYAGRLSTEKGIDLLLEAFIGSERNIKIIGEGPLQEKVIKAAAMYPNIVYLRRQTLQETYKIISKAKALIFPSKWHEPFGRTIVESFAHGTPVIGSELGGVSELIQNHHNGILFNPNAPLALKEAINVFEQQSNFTNMRMNAFDSYKNNFSRESNFNQIVEIYNTILSAKS